MDPLEIAREDPEMWEPIIVAIALGPDDAFQYLWAAIRNEDDNGFRVPNQTITQLLRAFMDFAEHPGLLKYAEQIVLNHTMRAVDGDPVDEVMRELIYAWCKKRLDTLAGNREPGRRTNPVKEFAVVWTLVQRLMANPQRKREALIAEVCQEFGLTRRRVFQLLEKLPPLPKPPQCN
jgi:hypothetical protein